CSQRGWLEVLGSGMINPRVFEFVKIDPSLYTGFAFGMGVDRICMLKYGIDDIRLLYENDVRFLKQF
ncbi:MAG: phenylalanine--tRNA ligase subunit alpha, partial [Candidatus Omnitrophota bacterium]|nr:phenylalanine--tRNA ligase subunit alpha [Candidatus Omnitrophota bacterium]